MNEKPSAFIQGLKETGLATIGTWLAESAVAFEIIIPPFDAEPEHPDKKGDL